MLHGGKLKEKLKEAAKAVLPIMVIVLTLCFSVAPVSSSVLLSFLMGGLMIIVGMMFFTLGAEIAMTPMGEKTGSSMTRSRNIFKIVLLAFILGFIITISEPDLQVLASQVPAIPKNILVLSVAFGVGLFLVLALLRMLFKIALPRLLMLFYALVFLLAFFVPGAFLCVAFDSGGVTTGPMTVPFIMALGVGVSAMRSDRRAADDSFGLVSMCSVGPIAAVLILGMIFNPGDSVYTPPVAAEITNSIELWHVFAVELPHYAHEIAMALLPVVVFFAVIQIVSLRLSGKKLKKILVGLIYTYVGLVLFLAGANVGFMPAGSHLGEVLAGLRYRNIIIPIGMIMGFFIVKAEPAVYVLNKQVEEITDGVISEKAMGASLSVGVALSVGIAMLRVITGISILWFLIPGYAIALGISFFVPKIYTAIAFDSGGVASGPMTATFLLPLAQGACNVAGGNVVTDAFGVVAMVAMTPLITIQVLGLVSHWKKVRTSRALRMSPDILDDDAIINL